MLTPAAWSCPCLTSLGLLPAQRGSRLAPHPTALCLPTGDGEGFEGSLERGLVWAGRGCAGANVLLSQLPASDLSLYKELRSRQRGAGQELLVPRLPNTHSHLQCGLGFISADAGGPALGFLSWAGDLQESWSCASKGLRGQSWGCASCTPQTAEFRGTAVLQASLQHHSHLRSDPGSLKLD